MNAFLQTVPRWPATVIAFITTCAAWCGIGAAEFPSGTFIGSRQADWSITFEKNGRFAVVSAGQPVAKGVYEATATEVTFTEDSGPPTKPGDATTGTYAWRHDWGTLAFTLVRDDTKGRELLLTGNDWIDSRVSRLGAWVRRYYQNPTPDALVEKVKEMSVVGVLEPRGSRGRPDANLAFIGMVMKANPARIAEWMDQLTSLPASEQQVLKKAVWYSQSEEGRAWLVAHGAGELANGPRPILFGDQVGFLLTSGNTAVQLKPHHLDQLWEWFFATGEAEPVIRLTTVFGLAHDMPDTETLDLLSPPRETSDEVQSALMASNYRLVRAALWSATSLATHDDRVLSILVEQRERVADERVRAWIQRVVEVAEAQRSETSRQQGK